MEKKSILVSRKKSLGQSPVTVQDRKRGKQESAENKQVRSRKAGETRATRPDGEVSLGFSREIESPILAASKIAACKHTSPTHPDRF